MITNIFVKVRIKGTHNWPNAPKSWNGFLAYPHRHEFNIMAVKPVYHDDRDVEFFELQHEIEEYIKSEYPTNGGVVEFGHKSCEMLARELVEKFGLFSCAVDEDGENGASVTNPKAQGGSE